MDDSHAAADLRLRGKALSSLAHRLDENTSWLALGWAMGHLLLEGTTEEDRVTSVPSPGIEPGLRPSRGRVRIRHTPKTFPKSAPPRNRTPSSSSEDCRAIRYTCRATGQPFGRPLIFVHGDLAVRQSHALRRSDELGRSRRTVFRRRRQSRYIIRVKARAFSEGSTSLFCTTRCHTWR